MKGAYDYIITGGGAAGRSLICRILQSPLRYKKILLIDRGPKRENDRTWCFWEKGPGFFEDIVHHSWNHLWVHTEDFSRLLAIEPYRYKLIRGLDFYEYTDQIISQAPHVDRYYGEITQLKQEKTGVTVSAGDQTFSADWCFNSIFFGKVDKHKVNYLDQHFRGWFIRTEEDAFDPERATLMDFRTPQHDETRFLYVLPYSAREALVEVAIFSNQHLSADGYDQIIRDYLNEHMPGIGNYIIEQVEIGNIPMTDFSFPRNDGRIIHLGMAGGDTRASSGYTFYNIQRRTKAIVENLSRECSPAIAKPWPAKRAAFYDRLMLKVLEQGYHPGSELFEKLFAKNKPAHVLAFLNAESNLSLELRLVSSLPKYPFLRALF